MESFVARVIKLFELIHPLDRVPRAGYLLRGVPEPESVAAHTHFVSLLALLVLDEYPDLFDRDKTLPTPPSIPIPVGFPAEQLRAHLQRRRHHFRLIVGIAREGIELLG